jgi:predicted ATPase with chaperone activity
VLSADRKVHPGRLEKTVLLGELALDGRVRPVRGVLPVLGTACVAMAQRVTVARLLPPKLLGAYR